MERKAKVFFIGFLGGIFLLGSLQPHAFAQGEIPASANQEQSNVSAQPETSVSVKEALERAKAAEKAEHGKEAEKWYRAAAATGDADGEYECGNFYYLRECAANLLVIFNKGQEYAQEEQTYRQEAFEWAQKSAAQNYPPAFDLLGDLYAYATEDHRVDVNKRDENYKKGAELGDAHCEYNWGRELESGNGVTADPAKGEEWIRKAAAQGDRDALLLYPASESPTPAGSGTVSTPAASAASPASPPGNQLHVFQDWTANALPQKLVSYQDTLGSKISFSLITAPHGKAKALKMACHVVDKGLAGVSYLMNPVDMTQAGAFWFRARSTKPGEVLISFQDAYNVQYMEPVTLSSKKWSWVTADLSGFTKNPNYTPPGAVLGHPMDLSKATYLSFSCRIPGSSVVEIRTVYTTGTVTPASSAQTSPSAAAPVEEDGAALFQKGLKAQDAGNKDEAFADFQKSANLGNADGENFLGVCYLDGAGVQADSSTAVSWFQKAASQGQTMAEGNLGLRYLMGDGVAQNEPLALQWVEKSNVPFFAGQVGFYYYQHDRNGEAVQWLQKAAGRGDTYSEVLLGQCYENGKGVARDLGQAKAYYEKGLAGYQANGNLNSVQWVQGLLNNLPAEGSSRTAGGGNNDGSSQGQAGSTNPTAEQAVQNGDYYGQPNTDHFDINKERDWYLYAAKMGNADAQYKLGLWYDAECNPMLTEPENPQYDCRQAVYWFQLAANQGNSAAADEVQKYHSSGW